MSVHEPAAHEGNGSEAPDSELCGADHAAFDEVLGQAVEVLERASVPHVVIGGVASRDFGRPRWTHDIDVLVKPEDAERALTELAACGFRTEKTDARWIYKAFKHRVMVDVIFRSTGGIHLDDEMISRSVCRVVRGRRLRFIPPEDLLVMKAAVTSEEGPRHWHDALGLVSSMPLDWDYVARRAIRAPRRVLSLLIYAHSLDLLVPNQTIRALYEQIYES